MDRKHHEVECTCSALRMASRRLTQAYDTALAAEGIRVSQYAVLSVLAKWGDYVPTMQELAERLALDRTTLGHNLGPLARDGFVDIQSDPDDRRSRRIVLTPLGRQKREICLPLWRNAQDRFDEGFGRERSEALRGALLAVARQGAVADQSRSIEEADNAG